MKYDLHLRVLAGSDTKPHNTLSSRIKQSRFYIVLKFLKLPNHNQAGDKILAEIQSFSFRYVLLFQLLVLAVMWDTNADPSKLGDSDSTSNSVSSGTCNEYSKGVCVKNLKIYRASIFDY